MMQATSMNIHIEYQPDGLLFDEFCRVDVECFPQEPINYEAFTHIVKKDFWAAYDSTILIGYCYVVRRHNISWLSRMCVAGQYRHRGIASQMMQTVIDNAKQDGMPDIMLYVESENLSAIRLYERFGFRSIESAYQFMIVDPEQIHLKQTSKSITAVPICEYEESYWPQFPREWTNIAEMHKPPERYVLLFLDQSGRNWGYCRLTPQFPGCFPLVVEQPLDNLLPVLQELRRYLMPGKEALILTFSDDELAEACRELGLKMNYQLYKMYREG
jgi:GNAT superfamily N-acetyltransferase